MKKYTYLIFLVFTLVGGYLLLPNYGELLGFSIFQTVGVWNIYAYFNGRRMIALGIGPSISDDNHADRFYSLIFNMVVCVFWNWWAISR